MSSAAALVRCACGPAGWLASPLCLEWGEIVALRLLVQVIIRLWLRLEVPMEVPLQALHLPACGIKQVSAQGADGDFPARAPRPHRVGRASEQFPHYPCGQVFDSLSGRQSIGMGDSSSVSMATSYQPV